MSYIGSPTAPPGMGAYYMALDVDGLQQAHEQITPVPENAPMSGPRAFCELLIKQGWGGEDEKVVEQKRRERIREPYWATEMTRKLDTVARHTHADCKGLVLEKLHSITGILDSLLSVLGVPRDEVHKARFEIPPDSDFWVHDLVFWQSLVEEAQWPMQSIREDLQLPSSTPIAPLMSEPPLNVPVKLPSFPSPPKLAKNAGVRKRRPNNHWTRRKKRALGPQKHPSAKEEEMRPAEHLESAPTARASRGRPRTKLAGTPYRLLGMRKRQGKDRK